jgi:hypothetical protein
MHVPHDYGDGSGDDKEQDEEKDGSYSMDGRTSRPINGGNCSIET